MSRKAVIVALGLLLIAAFAVYLYVVFSLPFNYTTHQEADAMCTVRAGGVSTVYQACMEDYGY